MSLDPLAHPLSSDAKISPVAYLGPAGTFSHHIAKALFPAPTPLIPLPALPAIFDFLLTHPSHRAVVPIENTSGGTLYGTVDLLIESAGQLFVQAAASLEIQMLLMGRLEELEPLPESQQESRESHPEERIPCRLIHRIFSHPIQLHNHREWLKTRYPQAELIAVESTALAAERAAQQAGSAALAAPGAETLYHLDILERPTLPGAINKTHFFALGHHPVVQKHPQVTRSALAVAFSNEPGSLYRFLEPFALAKLNMNRIISRPYPGRQDQAVFFLEIEGAPGLSAYDSVISCAQTRSELFYHFGSYAAREVAAAG